MAAFLLDWIRQLGCISGDARTALVRAVYEYQWSIEDFAKQVIESMPPVVLAESLTPFELAAVRRAWCAEFIDSGNQGQWRPWWQQDVLPLEPCWLQPSLRPAWPPPVGDPSWGRPQDEEWPEVPVYFDSSPRSWSPFVSRAPDPSPLFQQGGFGALRQRRLRGASVPRGRKALGRGMSTFACGAMSPPPDYYVERGDAVASLMPRRPVSAPPGRRAACGSRRHPQPPYNPPLGARRCSGGNPWWHTTAWSTLSPEVERPPDRPMPYEWQVFATAPDLSSKLRPWQDWSSSPTASVYGRRLTTPHNSYAPRWRR